MIILIHPVKRRYLAIFVGSTGLYCFISIITYVQKRNRVKYTHNQLVFHARLNKYNYYIIKNIGKL